MSTPVTSAEKPQGWMVKDLAASVVVFLVAMPLCMGIAIASGVPPEKGLVTGIIGGLVVGFLAGSPLQVSGPAAGLAVIVFELVRDHGISALGPILLLAGALQLIAGVLKLGGWFRAISPAVVHGMLAGIGALIVVGQFHTLFDAKPLSNGLENLAAMPGRVMGLEPNNIASTELALIVGLLTIALMLSWDKFRPVALKLVPGALIGVVGATLFAFFFGLDVVRVNVPESIISAVETPGAGFLSPLGNPAVLMTALAIAFIASAETLLSAAAVDRMHDGVRTDYNKELRAQGIGNMLCGAAGALPMTGVIVRSSANVQAGAVTRMSTILHGAWILGFVALLPWLLREIPMAALGGVLVVTGARLVSLKHVTHLFSHYGLLPAAIWVVTFALVVTTDLLTGVLAGLALSLVELVPHVRSLRLKVDSDHGAERSHVRLTGSATFISVPKLNTAFDAVPDGKPVTLDLHQVPAIDHSCAELLREWLQRAAKRGNEVELLGSPYQLKRLAV
ncbi:SulP family inorganic anion transporter [Sphingomonas immobilis]|uniref:SulP family inorganic anion transporter n=1 Tax=Sphingomonas immobilis TaxID=3063997 RepID=A0ABT8ZW51_9SPHN|nr:SulP family inorganic anion transporter [Sphingomonas sp. CA1-15]MDO7840697.1 SulP family inorganic anion transporter [Sphingomonas sp. CA1-15]